MSPRNLLAIALFPFAIACGKSNSSKTDTAAVVTNVGRPRGDGGSATNPMTFNLTSSAFAANASIPIKYTCEGTNISPPLAWAGAPAAAKSFAIIVEDPDARKRLARICRDGMAAEVKDRVRNVETATWFRFSNRELEETRDGFNLEHNGKSGFERWFAETFLLRRDKSADPEGTFAKGAIDMARDQADSAPAFGVLTTTANTRSAQVLAGRAYARVALTAQALGLAVHPMSQALEEYGDMAPVKARLEHEVALAPGATVQMLFRLGYAAVTPHTPRRSLHDMVRST